MITETLMRPGSGSLQLKATVPYSVTKQILDLVRGVGCHVVITPVRVDTTSMSDANMLAAAMYTGRVMTRPSRTTLEFMGLSSWLDTYLEAATSRTAGTPTQWLGDFMINGFSAGTVSGGSNVTMAFSAYGQTYREMLDVVANAGSWEYLFQPDFTVDAGTASSIFVSTPKVVITNREEGPDGAYIGLAGGLLDQHVDVSGQATKAVAIGQGTGDAVAVGSATQSLSLKTKSGGTPSLVAVLSAPSVPEALTATAAANALASLDTRYNVSVKSAKGSGSGAAVSGTSMHDAYVAGKNARADRERYVRAKNRAADAANVAERALRDAAISASNGVLGLRRSTATPGVASETDLTRRILKPGDYVYLYDVESGLVDTANQITYRGELICPIIARCLSMSWPIESGYGVYVRSNAATPTYIDVTPFVEWESGGATIDVGDRPVTSYNSGSRTDPVLESRIAASSGYITSAGGSGAQTGISSITDLTGCTVTFTASASRIYKTTLSLPRCVQSATPGEQRLTIADGSSTTLAQTSQYATASQPQHHVIFIVESGLSGSTTRKGRIQALAGTCDTTAGFLPSMLVEDIGPA